MSTWGDAFGILRDILYGKLQYLDLYEQTTLAFIFGRTHLFKKEWEAISLSHFMNGVWSRDGECVAPRIRISEAKLIESLKSLEAKTIIEIERRPPRRSRYRIRPEAEFDLAKALTYIVEHQPGLLKMIVKEMEHFLPRLSESGLRLLQGYREAIYCHETGQWPESSPTGEASTPPQARQRAIAATSKAREHNIPILSKRKLPIPQLASRKPRRKKLLVRPLSSLR